MKKERTNEGITLIALVITIIILLILAAVSIAMLTGSNGLLTKAIKSKEEHLISQYKEEINLSIAEELAERKTETKTEPMIESLEKKIKEKDWVAKTSKEKQEGSTAEYLIVESKEGYEFIIEVDNEKETAKIIETNKTPGEKYTITYHPNEGDGDAKTVEVRKGFNKKLEKNNFTRADYIFVGWCEDKDGNGKKYMEESIYQVNGNVTLYAIWSYNIVTITFDANGGTGAMESKNVTKGETAVLPVNSFTKEDNEFIKWNTEADGTGTDYMNSGEIVATKDITLYAIWKRKPITADVIKKNPSSFYGAIVSNYSAKTIDGKDYNDAVANWKIFYADENNIYLIADDYIAYEYVPVGRGGTPLVKGLTNHSTAFCSGVSAPSDKGVLVDYTGTDDIVDERIKALNNQYFEKGYTSSDLKMKAVAYMLDTKRWGGFAGNGADYAVGGPSIEMLLTSYSQKYKVAYLAKTRTSNGYSLSRDGGASLTSTIEGMLNKNDSLYVISSNEKANSMWVASPMSVNVAYSNSALAEVRYKGDVAYGFCNSNDNGFRPLVCLNSNVQLEKSADGTYKIY